MKKAVAVIATQHSVPIFDANTLTKATESENILLITYTALNGEDEQHKA
jgi:hypothetical protein